MRTRTNSIVAAFVLLSLVSGAIGCRSNGGPWYNPKSYAFHNPFKSGDAPAYDAEGTAQANPKPNIGAQPNVNTPPGGYTNKEDEARFLASGNKEVVPQYGTTAPGAVDGNRVASSAGMAAPQSVYPETQTAYNPYAPIDSGMTAGPATTMPGYQAAGLHQPTTGAYSGTVASQDPLTYPGTTPAMTSAPTAAPAPANGYSPYGNPVPSMPENAPIYGDPTATNPMAAPNYGQSTTPQGFGQQSYGVQTPAPQGFGAQPTVPQGYAAPVGAPMNANPTGYTATPSVYPPASTTGF